MKKLVLIPISIAAFLILVSSCKNNPDEQKPKQEQQINSEKLKEQLVKVNKAQVYSEDDQIEDFLKRYKYPVETTATGLRYYIYKTNKGIKPNAHSIVQIAYRVHLLDGTLCYSSDSTGNLVFQIGKTDLPVGLQEGVQLLSIGEKAVLITPSKLGYGFTGDGANIPPNAVLYYDVELLKIKK